MSQNNSDEDLPNGFELVKFWLQAEDSYDQKYIVLPQTTEAKQLVEHHKAFHRQRAAEAKQKLAKETEQQEADEQDSAFWFRASKKTSGSGAFDEAEKARNDLIKKSQEAEQPGQVEVFHPLEPLKLLNISSGKGALTDRDLKSRAKNYYDKILNDPRANWRDVSSIQGSTAKFEKLRNQHPNFEEVIRFVQAWVSLSVKSQKPLSIPPILLLGGPGVGKTHFAHSLASFIGTEIHKLSFDASYSSSSLLGSDRNWGNTHVGVVTEAILFGKTANPVFLLDELDKARVGGGYQDPRSSLHSLLEPVSASQVTDISLGFTFDSSHIIWIAAANFESQIPITLRSRFKEFYIEAPRGEQALQLATVVAHSVYEAMSLSDFEAPSPHLAKLLAHLTPREQRQEWERAYANAVHDSRQHLLRDDFSEEVFLDDSIHASRQRSLH